MKELNSMTVVTKAAYEFWKELLSETVEKFVVHNQSDYSGFQVEFTWTEE